MGSGSQRPLHHRQSTIITGSSTLRLAPSGTTESLNGSPSCGHDETMTSTRPLIGRQAAGIQTPHLRLAASRMMDAPTIIEALCFAPSPRLKSNAGYRSHGFPNVELLCSSASQPPKTRNTMGQPQLQKLILTRLRAPIVPRVWVDRASVCHQARGFHLRGMTGAVFRAKTGGAIPTGRTRCTGPLWYRKTDRSISRSLNFSDGRGYRFCGDSKRRKSV